MIRYCSLTLKDVKPSDSASQFHLRVAQNSQVQACKPGHRYYVVGGLHGDRPNGNGDYFAWDAELLRQLNGRTVYASDEIESHYPQPAYMYETWRGRGNYINHNSMPRDWNNHNRVGTIVDVYPDHANKCIDFLLEVDEKRAGWLVNAIDSGQVTDTSMGTYVEWSRCSHCNKIATDEANWCEHLREKKGKACPDPRNCAGGCAKFGMVHEINSDCTGLEDSWIISGHGADPDAKHKYTLANAEEDKMAFQAPKRASVAGSDGWSAGGDPDFAEAKREAMARGAGQRTSDVPSGPPTIEGDMLRMAQALGADKCRELGYDPVALGLVSAEDENMRIAQEAPVAQTATKEEGNEMTIGEIKEAVKQIFAEGGFAVPSPALQSGTGGENMKPNPDPSRPIDENRFGESHGNVDVPMMAGESKQLVPGATTTPSPATLNDSGVGSNSLPNDPASMIAKDKFGRPHPEAVLPMTTAALQGVISAALSAFAASMPQLNFPSVSNEGDGGGALKGVNTDPLAMITPEKPNSPHAQQDPPTSSEGKDAVNVAMPSASTKSEELGDKSYAPKSDPGPEIVKNQWGKPHPETKMPIMAAKGEIPEAFKKNIDKAKDKKKVKGKKPCKSGKNCDAEFVPSNDMARAMWEVTDETGQVMMRAAAGDVYPVGLAENFDFFASEGYGSALLDAIETDGLMRTAMMIGAQMSPGAGAGAPPPAMSDDPAGAGAPADMPPADESLANNMNPDPNVSEDIRGDDAGGVNLEDKLVGVLAVLINDEEANIDEIRAFLSGLTEPDKLEAFMGRVEQEMKNDNEANEDMGDALDGEAGEDAEPPALPGKGVTSQLKVPKGENDRSYYLQLFPPDFVNGLFAGSSRAVTAALTMIDKLGQQNESLTRERSKMLQAKRIDIVMDKMEKKGMLRSASDVAREDKIDEARAIRTAKLEYDDQRAKLFDMDEASFNHFVDAVNKVHDRQDKPATASIKQAGLRMVPNMRSDAPPRTTLADLEDDGSGTSLWDTPPDVESLSKGAMTKSAQLRVSKDSRQVREASMLQVAFDALKLGTGDEGDEFKVDPNEGDPNHEAEESDLMQNLEGEGAFAWDPNGDLDGEEVFTAENDVTAKPGWNDGLSEEKREKVEKLKEMIKKIEDGKDSGDDGHFEFEVIDDVDDEEDKWPA